MKKYLGIVKIYDEGIGVKTGNGVIILTLIQPEGKSKMKALDFLNGIKENIVGKVFAHIPKLGLLASPLATTAGKIGVALVILAGYLLTEVGGRLRQ